MSIVFVLLSILVLLIVVILYCCLRAATMGDEHMEDLNE